MTRIETNLSLTYGYSSDNDHGITWRMVAAGHYIGTRGWQSWTVIRNPEDMLGLPWLIFEGEYTDVKDTDHRQIDAYAETLREAKTVVCPRMILAEYSHDEALAELVKLTGAEKWVAERTLLFAFDKPSAGSTLAGHKVQFHKDGLTGRFWYTIKANA